MKQKKSTMQVEVTKPIGDNTRSTGNKVNIEYKYKEDKTIIECMEVTSSGQGSADSNIKLELESGNRITVEDTKAAIIIQCTGQVNEISPKSGRVKITRLIPLPLPIPKP